MSGALGQDPTPVDELAQRWLAAWAADGDFTTCATGDISYEDPMLRLPLVGISAVVEHRARLREAFPDLAVESTAPTLERGDHACFPWWLSGTHRGDIAFIPATHRHVSVQGLHYVELSDGLVRRARGFIDVYDGASQLGLIPERGGLGETAMLFLRGFGLRM